VVLLPIREMTCVAFAVDEERAWKMAVSVDDASSRAATKLLNAVVTAWLFSNAPER